MKLLVIILGFNDITDEKYFSTVKATFGKLQTNNISIYNSRGDSTENKILHDIIYVNKKDTGIENTYEKALEVFDVIYNNLEFDIILRTSLSTYFRLDLLYNILLKYELKNFFGSTFDHPLDSGCFAGSSMLLSRDVIKKILDIRHIENPKGGWDDTGIEYLLRQLYPNYTSLYKNFKRLDLMENSLIRLNDPLFKIKYGNIWAFRCKTPLNRDLDIQKMQTLHKIFYK